MAISKGNIFHSEGFVNIEDISKNSLDVHRTSEKQCAKHGPLGDGCIACRGSSPPSRFWGTWIQVHCVTP